MVRHKVSNCWGSAPDPRGLSLSARKGGFLYTIQPFQIKCVLDKGSTLYHLFVAVVHMLTINLLPPTFYLLPPTSYLLPPLPHPIPAGERMTTHPAGLS